MNVTMLWTPPRVAIAGNAHRTRYNLLSSYLLI